MRLDTPTLEDFTKILCELHCSKLNASFETVYCLCKGDINLAIKLIEQKYLDSLIKLFDNDIYDEVLNIVAALDLENEMDFRVFNCFIDAIASKLIGKGFSKYELSKKNYKLLTSLEKLQNIVTNLDSLNKKYSQEIIINIFFYVIFFFTISFILNSFIFIMYFQIINTFFNKRIKTRLYIF